MISWIQTVIQKHNKVLFIGLLAVIIVAFVFTIGNTGFGIGGGSSRGDFRIDFYGHDINPQSRFMGDMSQRAMISSRLNGRRTQDFEGMILRRIVSLDMANEYQIPQPTEAELVEFIKTIRAFSNPATGEFSPDKYTEFLDSMQNSPTMNEELVSFVIAEDFRIDKLNKAISGPGYVLPYQASREVIRRQTTWSLEQISLDKSKFVEEITPEDAALATYFEENKENYKIDEMVQLHYLEFLSVNFADQVEKEPTDDDIQVYFTNNTYKYVNMEDGKRTPKTLEEAREDVIKDWKTNAAKSVAGAEANQLTIDIYEATYNKTIENTFESIKKYVEDKGYTLNKLTPYNETNMPFNSGLPYQALQEGLTMDASSQPSAIGTNTGAAILFFETNVAAHYPELADVKDTVSADFKKAEEERLFEEKAEEIRAQLLAVLEANGSLEEKAKELEIEFKSFEDFTMTSPAAGLNNRVLSELSELDADTLSDVIISGNLALIVNVTKKEAPEADLESEEVKNALTQLQTTAAMIAENSSLNEIVTVGLPEPEVDESEETAAN